MPFIVPFLPAIAGGVGALLGGHGGKSDLNQQQSAGAGLLSQGQSLVSGAGAPLTQGLSTLEAARGDINQADSFFQRLLGSRSDEMNALSPEIAAVTSQYDASRRMRGNLAPRGGGATAANANAQFNEIGQIGDLLASGRTNAASGLLSGGSALAGVGGSEAGIGLNQLTAGLGAEGSSAGIYNQAQGTINQQQSALGEGIGSILGQMSGPGGALSNLLSKLFSKGGGGGGGESPIITNWNQF